MVNPSGMRFTLLAAVAVMGALSPSMAFAQRNAVQPIEPERRDERFSGREFRESERRFHRADERWNSGETVQFERWVGEGREAYLPERNPPDTTRRPLAGARQVQGEVRSFSTIHDPSHRSRMDKREARIRNQDRVVPLQPQAPVEITDRNAALAQRRASTVSTSGRTPALEDVNRFVFRKNGADETGPIPARTAGSGRSQR